MKLNEILKNIAHTMSGKDDMEITGIAFDSRKAGKGSLFFAINGNADNGEKYIPAAIENGATAIVLATGSPTMFEGAARIEVPDTREALAIAAANFYGNPSENINLVGITGTNGKTTTVTLLYELFSMAGYKCGLLSTIENRIAGRTYPADHTTPDPIELNYMLSEMCKAGCGYCFMEVSSHSIDQKRICGLNFAGAIFSNITHDHLDYHKTFMEYLGCKKRFFDGLGKNSFALINADDKNAEVMVQNCKAMIYRYSCRSIADFQCKIIEKSMEGMQLRIDGSDMWTSFIGRHNASNLLAVYAAARLLGLEKEETLTLESRLAPVPGRLEYIKGKNGLLAIVDYAHTPDALENVLSTIKEIAGSDHKICTVFGCGGDRDKTKRPEMAQAAAKYSDRIIVTSDNPRTEDPEAIINDIRAGFSRSDLSKTLFISDRKEALRTSVLTASPGTVILFAGKGHETYQIIGTEKHHFDDREILRDIFNEI